MAPDVRNVLLVDESRCIGCLGCVAACLMEHDLPAGPQPIRIVESGPFEREGSFAALFVPVVCRHCDRPACVAVCPAGAMQKDENGLVFSDREKCIGCRTCAAACPFGIPQLNPATGVIVKCDGCRERTDRGLWPACALKCPTEALLYGPASRLVQELRTRTALRTAGTAHPRQERGHAQT